MGSSTDVTGDTTRPAGIPHSAHSVVLSLSSMKRSVTCPSLHSNSYILLVISVLRQIDYGVDDVKLAFPKVQISLVFGMSY